MSARVYDPLVRAVLVCVCLFSAVTAHAQRADVLVRGSSDEGVSRMVDALRAAGAAPVTSAQALLAREPLEGASPRDLETLDAVERALTAARTHAAELDERAALADVARAQRHASALVGMPAGRVFLAEVEIAVALVAWQLGNRPLAEASLARAVSLDPRRRLRAADADPDLVALADAILAAQERRPRASLVITSGLPASVYVDDVLVGATPARLDVRTGVHVVRIVAPLHAPYAALVAVERDLSLDVALSPRPAALLVAELEGALDEGDLTRAVHLCERLAQEGLTLRAAYGRAGEAVLCDARGCTLPAETLDADAERGSPEASLAAFGAASERGTASRSEQLRDERRRARAARERRRLWLGVAGGVVGAVLVTSVALVARPTTERLRVEVGFE